jgi:TonB family protein
MNKPFFIALAAVLTCAYTLPAQRAATAAPREDCAVVPDTVVPPTEAQMRDRADLRGRVAQAFRTAGHPATGLLYVDLDSTRRGTVMFIETEPSAETRDAATQQIAEYLGTVPVGKPYHALLRIDGEYPVLAPGARHCPPALVNKDDLDEFGGQMMKQHPMAGRVSRPQPIRASLILVIDRTGNVAWAGLERPTGDAFMDERVAAFAPILRFLPATVDGVPIDVRTRFNLTLHVR